MTPPGAVYLLIGAAILLALLCSCAPAPRPPLPELGPTLAQLDRAHDALIPMLVSRCVMHAGGRCLHGTWRKP